MSLTEFVERLLRHGRILLSDPVEVNPDDERRAATFLQRAFDNERLNLAGPPLAFDRGAALAAARFTAWSAWHLLSRRETDAALKQRLRLSAPASPDQHFSADLLLRYLPPIQRRAHAFDPADILTQRLIEVLLAWPLSGVLADLPDAPQGSLDFGGHAGLLLLYAERLAEHFKPAWIPRGPGFAHLELVWTDLGRDPALLRVAPAAQEEG